jgi:prepilin-type N-terminal cleavage/methylation domain-containing protein/prepilin-type processing-associated H-X9-DG protein
MKRAFTLIELLVVIAIVAILAAILFPVYAGAKESAKKTACSTHIRQLGLATHMYLIDADSVYPIAMYALPSGMRQTWFARETAPGRWDKLGGLLQPYVRTGQLQRCPSSTARPRFGDGSGYGYNWGYVGSDALIVFDFSGWPNLRNPALESALSTPAEKLLYADSGFINVVWYGGDNETYETGFIDPPMFWFGNPTVDFRHVDSRKEIDSVARTVRHRGLANIAWADGHVAPLSETRVKDQMFVRD